MRTRALVMAGVVALAVMSSTRVAHAQETMEVNVPFDFVAGGRSFLPANIPSMSRAQGNAHFGRSQCRRFSVIITHAAVAPDPQTESKLIFNRYGDRYFLSQVWSEGNPRVANS